MSKKKVFELREYICGYCANVFREYNPGNIICPRCKNYAKISEGKLIKTTNAGGFFSGRLGGLWSKKR